MIEQLIQALTEALDRNTAALNLVIAKSGENPLPGNPMPVTPTAAAPKKGKTKVEVIQFHQDKEPTKTVTIEEEVEIPELEPEPETTEPEPEPAFDRDAMIEQITAAVKENYRKAGSAIGAAKEKFEALRKEFGVSVVKELTDEQLVAFWPRVQTLG
jgi:hypothetical protein